jgi:hypothetical protein
VNVVEWLAVGLFAFLGLRSMLHWLRRPFEADSRRDVVLYALFVVSRAGLWFALAGLFALYASIEARGRAFVDIASSLRWYFFVLAIPAAGQFVTGFLLSRPGRDRDATPPP